MLGAQSLVNNKLDKRVVNNWKGRRKGGKSRGREKKSELENDKEKEKVKFFKNLKLKNYEKKL